MPLNLNQLRKAREQSYNRINQANEAAGEMAPARRAPAREAPTREAPAQPRQGISPSQWAKQSNERLRRELDAIREVQRKRKKKREDWTKEGGGIQKKMKDGILTIGDR